MPSGSLQMPNPSSDTPPVDAVAHEGTVVIVGANGTGKSRLGALLEERSAFSTPTGWDFHVRRISAQRLLNLPGTAERKTQARAQMLLARGYEHGNRNTRVAGDPITGQMNDFGYLAEALFAERDAQALAFMNTSANEQNPLVRPKKTILDQLVRAWQNVFPERQLLIGDDNSIRVQSPAGGPPYDASAMSDGERVGFYLLSHALLAPEGVTLLIDEPELHLHESIQGLLWDTAETERQDCTFVYITHDLGFAASRVAAAKVLLRGYETIGGGKPVWDWQMAPTGLDLPEDVVLRIAGSRRPTIFVEGITGSVDQELYDAAYPGRYVVPSDNCDAVIQAVHSFQNHTSLHRFDVSGIIDRDDRTAAELALLNAGRVHALGYAQAENVLVADEVMKAFCAHQKHDATKAAALVAAARTRVLDLLKQERESTIARRALWNVERKLHKVSPAGTSEPDLVAAVAQAASSADAHGAFAEATTAVDSVLSKADYEGALRLLRNKGVVPAACTALGARPDGYRRIAASLLRDDAKLRASLSRVLPTL